MPACRLLSALLLGSAGLALAVADVRAEPAPVIQALGAQLQPRLDPGTGIEFLLRGTPGGHASLTLAGSRRTIVLTEQRPGEYFGRYTVRPGDVISAASLVRARLRVGGRSVSGSATLVAVPVKPAPRHDCAACGVVQSVQIVEVEARSGYPGPVVGGLAGVVLGSQIGEGSGSRLAGVLGASAYVTRESERRPAPGRRYEVTVRLSGGGVQAVTLERDPQLDVGARVRIIDGGLLADD